ncbi:hypothetical protein QTG54_000614 [Skeletonema marinoi]|uniref:Uncharacterized protein n=1 Tax=Skeletonema marinoi TaxID=267567 RepID=A0AAD8YNM4_9STRA|nr:hypothetical protein QTG54_000614 [Skeletonema marinoi]
MIHHSSQMIGAAAAFRPAQEASEAYLQEKSHQTWRRVKIKILTIMRFGGSLRAKKNGGPQASSGDDKRMERGDRPLQKCMSYQFECVKTLRRQLSKPRTIWKPKLIVGSLRCMEVTQVFLLLSLGHKLYGALLVSSLPTPSFRD